MNKCPIPNHPDSSLRAFTLVELAIVLVIIGLIIGGVLVGQDLIKAAQIRSVISDLEKFNSAATTFRGKYNGFPGDITSSSATAFNFTTRAGTAGRGNGNGLIEGGSSAAVGNASVLNSETALFWADLSSAAIIPVAFTTATDAASGVLANSDAVATFLPRLKIRSSSFVYVYADNGRNYYYLANISSANAAGVLTKAAGLSNGEAYTLDSKIDDGYPDTGSVTSQSDFATLDAGAAVTAGTSSPAVCRNTTTTPDQYNIQDLDIAAVACQVRVRTSF